ncbi:unnamed protein product [Plutella xylostella]|uniref:(diamondback moth) hypothetical protein n=1 Tax=Plutella xylostella TaxID=51655 RepID=A0A8S4EI44_PLUXY|nr:unnamed protein product [Plutella xylostella]
MLNLTARREYQQNETLRRVKLEKINQEFIITEKGLFYMDLNECPPYVLDLEKPQPFHLALSVSVSSKGQRDGYTRMDALHSKLFRDNVNFYAKEEIPTYHQLVQKLQSEVKPRLSRRVTSGICDAIVNKALFHVYNLHPKEDSKMKFVEL